MGSKKDKEDKKSKKSKAETKKNAASSKKKEDKNKKKEKTKQELEEEEETARHNKIVEDAGAEDKDQVKASGDKKKAKARNDDEKKFDPNPLQLPTSERDLAACKKCHRILTTQQFLKEGCRSCAKSHSEAGVPMKSSNNLREYTTQQFYGHVGVVHGESSWISRLIGLRSPLPGVYAARVGGKKEEE